MTSARHSTTLHVVPRLSLVLWLLAGLVVSLLVTIPAVSASAAYPAGAPLGGLVRAGKPGPVSVLRLVAPLRRSAQQARWKARGNNLGRPLFTHKEFPDPTGIHYRNHYIAVATGSLAPRSTAPSLAGPWRDHGSALAHLPRWATGRQIWASDLVRVKRRWLLYFAAPAAGLGPLGRCIGVAVATNPLGKFRPRQRPLTCPTWARAPRASDRVRPPSPSNSRGGVIDPEGFRTRDGERYLLYRTQGTPSSIRMVHLTRDGSRARRGARSRILAWSRGVVENPVLVQQRKGWVLLTSEGYYGNCNYRTTWRRAPTLQGLKHSNVRPLINRRGSRLCGPGGADLVDGSALFFHAWACGDRRCPSVDLQRFGRFGARRALFAAHLRWDRRGRPHLGRFVKPVRR